MAMPPPTLATLTDFHTVLVEAENGEENFLVGHGRGIVSQRECSL